MANAIVRRFVFIFSALLALLLFGPKVMAQELKVGDTAPLFKTKNQEGKDFDLSSRRGQWTVLYFYPKAGTPGCTKQAGSYNKNVEEIRKRGADVFGISTDTVKAQKEFHTTEKLNFTLLADPDGGVVGQYGTKMLMLSMSKRWTYILDPELKIRFIQKDVDPVADSQVVIQQLSELKKTQ